MTVLVLMVLLMLVGGCVPLVVTCVLLALSGCDKW